MSITPDRHIILGVIPLLWWPRIILLIWHPPPSCPKQASSLLELSSPLPSALCRYSSRAAHLTTYRCRLRNLPTTSRASTSNLCHRNSQRPLPARLRLTHCLFQLSRLFPSQPPLLRAHLWRGRSSYRAAAICAETVCLPSSILRVLNPSSALLLPLRMIVPREKMGQDKSRETEHDKSRSDYTLA